MSERPLACPEEDLLLGFAEGKLAGPLHAEVLQHLSGCDVCLAAVGGVGRAASASGDAEEAAEMPTAFQAGELVAGRYSIRRFIARGGMGEVYEAADQLLNVRVALKTVVLEASNSARSIEQIRREVQVARAINHPGVCRVFDLGEHAVEGSNGPDARRFFLTMEFLDGETLGQRIREQGPLDEPALLPLARQLAEGLAAAHDAGVVHRDFKSDNVMLLSRDGSGRSRAVVMDFGLARGVPQWGAIASSTAGMLVGSAAYMAPEQVGGGPVGQAADVYAFGVVLFECATGSLPFSAPTAVATAAKRLFEDPPRPRRLAPKISPAMEEVILRCMAREPGERFASMREVSRVLQEQSGPPSSVAAGGTPERAPRPRGRRVLPWAMAGGAVAIAAIAVGASIAAGRGSKVVERAPPAAPAGPAATTVPAGAAAAARPVSPPAPAPSPPPLANVEAASGNTAPPPVPRTRPKTATATATAAAARDGDRRPQRRADAAGPASKAHTRGDAAVTTSGAPSPAPHGADEAAQKKLRSQSPLDGFGDPFQ